MGCELCTLLGWDGILVKTKARKSSVEELLDECVSNKNEELVLEVGKITIAEADRLKKNKKKLLKKKTRK